MSLKEEKISFSDQISSRLHRWVQRTTSKVRNEKERKINHEENQDVIKESEIKKCTPREEFTRRSRESRSYEELERALKDLINNCVTSSSEITHDNTNINITKENNNNKELAPTAKTNSDIGTEFNDQFGASKHVNNVGESGSDSLQEKEKNSSGTIFESHTRTNVDALPHCLNKQNDVGENLIDKKEILDKVSENDTSLISSGDNERNSEHEKQCNKDFNKKHSDICEINLSLSNVNKGLNTRIDRFSLKTPSSQNSLRKLNKKPPLRRIQSEGDALELKLCFKDNDVTEFAATCIRHAEKKRFSDTSPDQSVDPMLNKTYFVSEETKSDSKSLLLNDVSVLNDKESTDSEQTIPEICLDQIEHIPLSDRPSSFSFPLETPKRMNKASSLKSKTSRHSPSSPPRSVPSPSLSSSSRPTPSPKFRRFPCQPVFYVPKPSESPTVPNNPRKGSIGEQPKEYLI